MNTNSSFTEMLPIDANVAREQSLLLEVSRHLYLDPLGRIRYQGRALQLQTQTNTRLMRYMLIDADSGDVYAELHDAAGPKALAEFLARAWSIKPRHPMRGVPARLNVSATIRQDPTYEGDLALLGKHVSLTLGTLDSDIDWLPLAVKRYERAVMEICDPDIAQGASVGLAVFQQMSAIVSSHAFPSKSDQWRTQWEKIAPLATTFLNAIDARCSPIGAWRHGAFQDVLRVTMERT